MAATDKVASAGPPLSKQVHSALSAYALGDACLLRALFTAKGLSWQSTAAEKMVTMAAAQITDSLEKRGETSYSLRTADGQPNETRIGSVCRYFEKLVAKRATQSTGSKA